MKTSRRHFLKQTACMTAAAAIQPGKAAETQVITELSPHLLVFTGPINVGIIRHGRECMLIDTGDGRVSGALNKLGIDRVKQIIFTHHHRDQACGAHRFSEGMPRILVPAAERPFFDDVQAYWSNPKCRWHIYNQHPHHLMLAESLRVDGTVSPGDHLTFGPASITVLDTPGHTDGHVSYRVSVDGLRVCFSGDVIYDEGKIWELYSLQKGVQTTDYHGFLGARKELVASLEKIRDQKPSMLVPSHGRIMRQPAQAVDALVKRLEKCYDKYVAISALRYYFPKLFSEYKDRRDHMAIRPGKAVPACLRHVGTSWILVSRTGAAFVMDCGNSNVVKALKQWKAKGEISDVEGLWVTHYHDDHVDSVPEFQAAFSCDCITDRHVADVISRPLAWRLPCISPSRAKAMHRTRDGEKWKWREFTLTAFHLPGQTLYHAGLLAEKGDLRMLFVGDSFTPGGIDDYCAHNRNWLGRNVGFDRCIALIEKLKPTHIFNCHVGQAFDFTPAQCRFMRDNLAEREKLYRALFPWDHPNYGMDEPWIRAFPYESAVTPGSPHTLDVVITNHSTEARRASVRCVLPGSWTENRRPSSTAWSAASIPPKQDGAIKVAINIPASAPKGRHIIPIDVRYGDVELPQFTETVMVI